MKSMALNIVTQFRGPSQSIVGNFACFCETAIDIFKLDDQRLLLTEIDLAHFSNNDDFRTLQTNVLHKN